MAFEQQILNDVWDQQAHGLRTSSTPPVGGATEAKQDDIIQAINDLPILPDNHQVTVSNPTPATDVSALATHAKQDLILAELQQKTEPSNFQLVDLLTMIKNLFHAIANPSYVDKSANQLRAQVTGTITTVTTVTTVTGVTNFGTFPADHLQRLTSLNTWAANCRSLIT